MEQRRFILFLTLSMAVLIGWTNFVVPIFFPGVQPGQQAADDGDEKPAQGAAADNDGQPGEADGDADGDQADQPAPVAGDAPADEGLATTGTTVESDQSTPKASDAPADQVAEQPAAGQPADAGVAQPGQQAAAVARHPRQTIKLGSPDPESGFFMEVTLTTQGAAVTEIALNDPRYRDLENRTLPLKLVGNDGGAEFRTLETSIEALNEQFQKQGVRTDALNWEVVPGSKSASAVDFRLQAPDGSLEVVKHYELKQLAAAERNVADIRNHDATPYTLQMQLTFRNLGQQPATVTYDLQGPVGLPLENADHTSKFRDIRAGFLETADKVTEASLTSANVDDAAANNKLEEWKAPIKYIGVDVQYFAALLIPGGNQLKEPYIDSARPVVVEKAPEPKRTDISVALTSEPIELEPGASVTHSYSLFAGPKRQDILDTFQAGTIGDFGWFSGVSRGMLWLMNHLHSWGVPYGIAIIMLTIVVRGCLYPISRKQAAGAKKMKDLQPKIAELRKKYANQKDQLAKAQMELFSKHNYNPLAGCLPIFLQLPIFIGLYRALSGSVDLRMAPFLWVDNLAAPDALFEMPFSLPFLGSDFNLLPLITVGLFIAQQKMFMPPATDPEQALQQKMMSYMMVFMGFMFYHVPAGLCVYFIASSLWGMGERKLLDLQKKTPDPIPETDEAATTTAKSKKPNLWSRLAEQLDAAAKKMDSENQLSSTKSSKDSSSDRKKKSRQRR